MRRSFLLLLLLPLSCKPVAEPAASPAPISGRGIYMARCVACHQADGGGIPVICPPLANSPRMAGPPEDLIRILLLGMKGGIVRNGSTFNGIMPSWRFDLTDGQIADVINDLYARWNPGAAPVTAEMVRRIRKETATQKLFPTEKDLRLSD
jgi:mono/diheme cytochrome c family protein